MTGDPLDPAVELIHDVTADADANRARAVQSFLEAVISQEKAISHFLQAEALKIEAFTGRDGEFPHSPTHAQRIAFQTGVAHTIEALADMQKHLLRTVECTRAMLAEQERYDAGR